MSTKHLVTLRGTGEHHGDMVSQMWAQVWQRVDQSSGIEWHDVDYPASISAANPTGDLFGDSMHESIEVGVRNLTQVLDGIVSEDPNARIVLGGYSLGACVIEQYLATTRHIPDPVVRAVFIANPYRKPMGSHEGSGIAWTPTVGINHTFRRVEVWNEEDPITNLSVKSPLRNVVPWLYALDLNKLDVWMDHIQRSLNSHMLRVVRSNLGDVEWRRAALNAPRDLIRYMLLGEHTTAYITEHQYGPEHNQTAVEATAEQIVVDLS